MTTHRLIRAVAIVTLAAWSGLAAAGVRVLAASGVVRITDEAGVNYVRALPGQELSQGAVVVTGEDGKVTLEVNPGNTVRLRGNAKLVIGTVTPSTSRFKLLAGRIKGIFKGLSGDQRFQLEFANTSAVASVKGTVFEAERTADGFLLHTLYGLISLNVHGLDRDVPQGFGATGDGIGSTRVVPLSEQEIVSEIENEGSKKAKDGLSQFVEDTRNGAAVDQNIVTQTRNEDFTAGRTLKDVHGNIARVEQRILRPTPNTIEFINLTKRESYVYHGRFSYDGPSGPRYDYFDGLLAFNMDLPATVDAWPSFAVANKDTFKALTADFTLANGKPSDPTRDVFMRHVDIQNSNNPSSGPDAVTLTSAGVAHTYYIDKNAPKQSDNGGDSLWATNVLTAYTNSSLTGSPVSIRIEGYGIDGNTGNVLTLSGLIGGSADPIGLLGTVGVEGIVSIADANGNSLMSRGNIDLVVIPDIGLAIAKRYAPTLAQANLGGN